MAAPKFLQLVSGKLKEIYASVTGTPNAIVATDATGRIDISFMPIGVGAETVVAPTSDNLAAGDFVNIYLNAGVATLRKADATTNSKPAHGFVSAITTSPAVATMYILGVTNSNVAGLTAGTRYFLDKTVPGGLTATAPSATGNIVQELGIATSATSVLTFDNQSTVEIA